jgi:hypothetical protein
MSTTTATEIDARLVREVEEALRLHCEMPDCLSAHRDPATWEIEVRHHWDSHELAPVLICSKCRNGLYLYRREEIACQVHGPLGYSVAAWWRPLRVI